MPTTFSGPIRVGGTTGASPAPVTAARELAIAVTATANTDFTLTVPKSRILRITTFTTTAFGAATDATLQVGSAAAGAQYVAAVSIKNAGVVEHTLVAGALGALSSVAEGTTLYFRVVQTGTASATGAALVVVELLPQT